ncbi:MAG: signal peptide peptidase SppA [Planctomycetota bacterium]|nr:signal peptide peptidase SppA [Planctomycetota bacterium]
MTANQHFGQPSPEPVPAMPSPASGTVSPMPPLPPRSTAPQRRGGSVWLLVGALCLIGGFMLIFLVGALALFGFSLSGGKRNYGLRERVIDPGDGLAADKIAVLSLEGVILGSGSHIEGSGVIVKLARQLRCAAEDDDVKAIILQIDSPGGGLSASDILYQEVIAAKKRGKPVVALVGSLAASGGYYIASPCDWIIATPTSMVGSIGAIMMHFEIKDLLERLGIKAEYFKSCVMKDVGSPFRAMNEEERAYLQSLIDGAHRKFVSAVARGRDLPEEDVRSLADGRIFFADEAQAKGLINQIGYFDDAVEKAKALAGISGRPRLVVYGSPFSLEDLFGAGVEGRAFFDRRALLDELEAKLLVPRLLALWTVATQPAPR